MFWLKTWRSPECPCAEHWGIQGTMHGNEPLKKMSYTQIKTAMPFTCVSFRFFYKVKPEPFSNKTSTESRKDSGKQFVPRMCSPICLGISRAQWARRRWFVAGRGTGGLLGTEERGSSHHQFDVRLHVLTSIHLSIPSLIGCVAWGRRAGNLCLSWYRRDACLTKSCCSVLNKLKRCPVVMAW